MEEFEEAEVIWSDQSWSGDDVERQINIRRREFPLGSRFRRHRRGESDPVRIPTCRPFKAGADAVFYREYKEEEEEEEGSEGEEMVPPHLVIARRIARKTTFSVCTGSGRTLKGRDLSRLRNSVLRMTGFLEA